MGLRFEFVITASVLGMCPVHIQLLPKDCWVLVQGFTLSYHNNETM